MNRQRLFIILLGMCLLGVVIGRINSVRGGAQQGSLTTYIPVLVKPLSPDICDNIDTRVLPYQATYPAGEVVNVTVTGASPEAGMITLHWARTSAQTHLPQTWTPLPLTWNPVHGRYETDWLITDALTGPSPYNLSQKQEFVLAATLFDEAGKVVCAGELSPSAGQPSANCPNCNRIIVSQNVPEPGLNLTGFWNIAPGYSVTYLGERLDNPEDDSGNPVSGAFITRLDYEAPVRLCGDTDVIPQRWTKNNRWGYWLPAAAKPEDRNGSFWAEGNANYRFFVTHPTYDYPWVEDMMGAYAQKVYRIEDGQYVLGQLGQVFDRTILNTSRQGEYFNYPPYLLSSASVPLSGFDAFARIDSSYHYSGIEMREIICQPQLHTEDHYWYTRVQLLTDSELLDGFATIESYLGGPKEIAVLTFFEAIGLNNGRTTFREDWYLMQDVGVVGIDQAFWDVGDAASATVYFNAAFMKEGTATPPHVQLRADRAYLGHTLQVTAVSPSGTFPLIVNPGECYTVAIHSLTSTPMPYDGYLEHNFYDDPSLWRSAVDGQPHWAENGLVTSCLPDTFPSGETRVHLRPYTMTSPSEHETQLFFSEKPWSMNELWVIVP